MSKDEYVLLFEEEQRRAPYVEEIALVDGGQDESGVWQLWARYQRGHKIASLWLHVGQQVYALYWHKTGYWGFVNYKVTQINVCEECTIDNMAQRKEYVVVTNKYGKVRRIPLHALGYTVLTTIHYAQRAAAINNAKDHEKVLEGAMATRQAGY